VTWCRGCPAAMPRIPTCPRWPAGTTGLVTWCRGCPAAMPRIPTCPRWPAGTTGLVTWCRGCPAAMPRIPTCPRWPAGTTGLVTWCRGCPAAMPRIPTCPRWPAGTTGLLTWCRGCPPRNRPRRHLRSRYSVTVSLGHPRRCSPPFSVAGRRKVRTRPSSFGLLSGNLRPVPVAARGCLVAGCGRWPGVICEVRGDLTAGHTIQVASMRVDRGSPMTAPIAAREVQDWRMTGLPAMKSLRSLRVMSGDGTLTGCRCGTHPRRRGKPNLSLSLERDTGRPGSSSKPRRAHIGLASCAWKPLTRRRVNGNWWISRLCIAGG
jgi:hypothetical protein